MEPKINIGILWNKKVGFSLHESYIINGETVKGSFAVEAVDNKMYWQGKLFDELLFEPSAPDASFTLHNVTIGINFHWERKEDQRFEGALKLIVDDGLIIVINILEVESYLTSVISSEMSATASLQLLKAHAVISRSWLLAQIEKNKEINRSNEKYTSFTKTESGYTKWYDREDHTLFDVCADDHCQRYQGITRTFSNIDTVRRAIDETRGEVLVSDSRICDARFSKCCGGIVEEFQNCWENTPFSYLRKLKDTADQQNVPDLTIESESVAWITSRPEAFCNSQDKNILMQVLNNYDQETTDFYRWTVTYTQDELSELVKRRSGIDFGTVEELIPVERGTSGRLIKLKIVGSKQTLVIGKELEIRRILSQSHLYSSAFVINKKEDNYILTGAGWGHGVGLCQIGAAVMGEKGYSYDQILYHYYIGAGIEKYY